MLIKKIKNFFKYHFWFLLPKKKKEPTLPSSPPPPPLPPKPKKENVKGLSRAERRRKWLDSWERYK